MTQGTDVKDISLIKSILSNDVEILDIDTFPELSEKVDHSQNQSVLFYVSKYLKDIKVNEFCYLAVKIENIINNGLNLIVYQEGTVEGNLYNLFNLIPKDRIRIINDLEAILELDRDNVKYSLQFHSLYKFDFIPINFLLYNNLKGNILFRTTNENQLLSYKLINNKQINNFVKNIHKIF